MSELFNINYANLFKKPQDWTSPDGTVIQHQPYKKLLRTDIREIFQSKGINDPFIDDREIVAQVFPFKVNQHMIDIIDWQNYQSDPLFQLTFPQPAMLLPEEIQKIKDLKASGASRDDIADAISDIRTSKNPAPANQAANRPLLEDDNNDGSIALDGLQHKYKPIVLMFHKNAQTCHAYCTYCFRFNQFVGKDKFLEN